MIRTVINYTDGTVHKLSFKGYDLENSKRITDNNISGFPELTVSRVKTWVDWTTYQ